MRDKDAYLLEEAYGQINENFNKKFIGTDHFGTKHAILINTDKGIIRLVNAENNMPLSLSTLDPNLTLGQAKTEQRIRGILLSNPTVEGIASISQTAKNMRFKETV